MNKERLTEQFLEIVQIDSVSGQERKVADYLLNLLTELDLAGFEDNTQDVTGYGAGNLIFTLKRRRKNFTGSIYGAYGYSYAGNRR
jgi:Di- and tripeptidases